MQKDIVRIFLTIFSLFTTNLYSQTLESVLDRYFEAIGGRENIMKISTSEIAYYNYQLSPKVDTAKVVVKERIPFFRVMEWVGKKSRFKVTNNDKGNYLVFLYPVMPVISGPVEQKSDITAIEIHLYDHDKKLIFAGDSIINDKICNVLITKKLNGDDKSKLYYFDKQSGLLIASKKEGSEYCTYYKNYKMVNSILLPFTSEAYHKDNLLNRTELDKIEFNNPIELSQFEYSPPNYKNRNLNSKFSKIEFVQPEFSELTFTDLISKFKGKRILIDMWATWCGPCKTEFLKYDDHLYGFLHEQKIEMLFISIDQKSSEKYWRKDIDSFNLNGYHLNAAPKTNLYKSIEENFSIDGSFYIPRYILINEIGKILSDNLGKPSSNDFQNVVRSLLIPVTGK